MWNSLKSTCLQIGVWCQCNRFEFVSTLILSSNQSRATLWVHVTWLIVGLQPLTIILITASLSTKTHNIALEPECFEFDGTGSILAESRLMCLVGIWLRMLCGVLGDESPCNYLDSLVLLVSFGEEWKTSITKSQRSRAVIPSMRKPASREVTSVELCGTGVCFLHIHLVGTNVWLPKNTKTHPGVDFESSRSPGKAKKQSVSPGRIFHSNSVGLPSMRFRSFKRLFSEHH